MVCMYVLNFNSSCVSASSYSNNILVFLSKNKKCERILPLLSNNFFLKVLIVFGLESLYGKKIIDRC